MHRVEIEEAYDSEADRVFLKLAARCLAHLVANAVFQLGVSYIDERALHKGSQLTLDPLVPANMAFVRATEVLAILPKREESGSESA